ncbi:MAG: GNAT family N-acetyltransferase [Ruminococcus sp.]|nr:GNAT family N-acetyltransferase [Ruminococcus sp.]
MEMRIEIGRDAELFRKAEKIRMKVFVEEQGFAAEIEVDEKDETAFHVVAYDGDKPVGAARFFEEHGGYHVGRVAVLPEYRGEGVGRFIMAEIETYAANNGVGELMLSAQTRAADFYLKCGFAKYGDVYLEEGCPHIEMRKNIESR